jgi:hypothetical protein
MLKKSASGVLASLRDSTYGISGGKEPIRSHVIEASGSSEAWYVPPRLFTRCGLARGTGRLGAPGWAGETSGHFEHPGVSTPSEPFAKISVVAHVCTEFSRNLLDFLRHGVLFDCPRPGRQHLGTIIDRTLNLCIGRLLKHLIFPQNCPAIVVKHANSEVE